jgi:hypothetical protein
MKKSRWPCPICSELMLHDEDVMEYTLMSYRFLCLQGHYDEDYDTGNTRWTIGGEEFFHCWSESLEKDLASRETRKKAIRKQKDLWFRMEVELNSRIPTPLLPVSRAFQAATESECPACRSRARAIFADWLDDHGFHEEAAWQRELSRWANFHVAYGTMFLCDDCKYQTPKKPI